MSDLPTMLQHRLATTYYYLRGVPSRFLRDLDYMRRGVYVARGSFIDPGTSIGRRTRIQLVSHLGRCEIGNYCAIAGRLIVRSVNHHTQYVNLQGFAHKYFLGGKASVTGKNKGTVRIGHGVWIGDSVIVLPGAQIGNGAIIGAGSVVTKSIPAYSVSAGNPARVIKMRFSQKICEEIDKLGWWDWDQTKIAQNRWFFDLDLELQDEEALLSRLQEISS